jgi:hypothetical protein
MGIEVAGREVFDIHIGKASLLDCKVLKDLGYGIMVFTHWFWGELVMHQSPENEWKLITASPALLLQLKEKPEPKPEKFEAVVAEVSTGSCHGASGVKLLISEATALRLLAHLGHAIELIFTAS